jgi:hypothetical protein
MPRRRSRAVRTGITWLASSTGEIARTRTLLRSLSQQNTLDELGFLRLFNGFAECFYPAITTVMTRARYLIFLPAIFRHIEHAGLARNRDADRVSRDWQDKLRKVLAHNEPARGAGVIGKEAGRSVARVPSNIYWSALGALDIASRQWSESAYLETLTETRSATIQDDDRSVHEVDDDGTSWDPAHKTSGIIGQDDVNPKLTFALTRREAVALRVRYDGLRPYGEQSLMSYLIEWLIAHPTIGLDPAFPWAIPGVSGPLARVVEHGKLLSMLSHGATLIYNAMLFDKRRELSDPGTEAAFAAWYRSARDELKHWDLNEFRVLPCVPLGDEEHDDSKFLEEFRDCIVNARSPVDAYSNDGVRSCVKARELRMRPNRPRLSGGHYLRVWQPPEGYVEGQVYGLTYRHGVGKRFALDIAAGLQAGES